MREHGLVCNFTPRILAPSALEQGFLFLRHRGECWGPSPVLFCHLAFHFSFALAPRGVEDYHMPKKGAYVKGGASTNAKDCFVKHCIRQQTEFELPIISSHSKDPPTTIFYTKYWSLLYPLYVLLPTLLLCHCPFSLPRSPLFPTASEPDFLFWSCFLLILVGAPRLSLDGWLSVRLR